MYKDMEFLTSSTKEFNVLTIQAIIGDNSYLLYSKYNPTRDSKDFIEKHYDEYAETYLVYVFGLGYHINELESLIISKGKKYHIYVVECNGEIFKLAKKVLTSVEF